MIYKIGDRVRVKDGAEILWQHGLTIDTEFYIEDIDPDDDYMPYCLTFGGSTYWVYANDIVGLYEEPKIVQIGGE